MFGNRVGEIRPQSCRRSSAGSWVVCVTAGLALLGPASASCVAHAATVTFGSPTRLQDDGSNIDRSLPAVLAAINFTTNPVRTGPYTASNPNPNVVLNGVTFTPTSGLTTSSTYFTTNAGAGPDQNRASGVASSAAIYGLVYDASISANNSTPYLLTMRNLTPNEVYRLQLVFSASDARRTLTIDSGGGTSATVAYGTTDGPTTIIANFTADSTGSQLFQMNGLGSNNRTELSGFVLQGPPSVIAPVPLPTAAAIGSVAMFFSLATRRRPENPGL